MNQPLGVAVVGAGYWGPNLIRNFSVCEDTVVRWVVDIDAARARRGIGPYGDIDVTTDIDDVLGDDSVAGVAIATPAATHAELALRCFEAGKHVLVEKPLARTVEDGEKLLAAARDADLVLMCDHTFCYTPSVRKIRELISAGELGDIQFFDSVRINLGLVQSDIDVFWDLAPHDLSILDFILPTEYRPVAVGAQAADPVGVGHACVGYLTLPMGNGALAHVHVNWLSPTKIRTTIIGGSKKMLVWDDLRPSQRITMFDTGVELRPDMDQVARRSALVSYRTGDMVAPALDETEALLGVVQEFAASMREQRTPLTDGESGMRVLRTLAAVDDSLAKNGAAVPIGGD